MDELEKNAAGVAMYDLTLYRGDTFSLSIDVSVDNVAMNLDGYTVSSWVKPSGADGFAPICAVQGNTVQITFHHEHTHNTTWKKAVYDVQIRKNQSVKTILCGKIAVIGDVTP